MRSVLFYLLAVCSASFAYSDISLLDIPSGNYSEKRKVCGTKISVENDSLYLRTISNRFYGLKCDDNVINRYKVIECRTNKCFVRGDGGLKSIETMGSDLLLTFKDEQRLLINNQNINAGSSTLTRKVKMRADSWYARPQRIARLLTHKYCSYVTADTCEVTSYQCYDAKIHEITGMVYATCTFSRHTASEAIRN